MQNSCSVKDHLIYGLSQMSLTLETFKSFDSKLHQYDFKVWANLKVQRWVSNKMISREKLKKYNFILGCVWFI
jgi:hypothetical protein